MLSLFDIFRLMRLVNCLLAMIAVATGAYLTSDSPAYYGQLVSSLSVFFICAAGNILNDIRDRKIDLINRPDRVLVSGKISIKQAYVLMYLCSSIGLTLALAVNWYVFSATIVASLILIAYNLGLKRVPFLGNSLVAFLAGLTFVNGGLAVDPYLAFVLPGPLVPALFAFLIHLDREIVKDLQDMKGDMSEQIRTLPIVIGVTGAMTTVLVIFLLLIIVSIYPIFAGWYGPVYKNITLYLIDFPMLLLLILVWGRPSPAMVSIASTGLKIIMGLGLIALILG